ncbi:probable tubulin polyglutamylase ttll-15 [Amphiura filiformis]|uniref:probable tubulin polyglutamylase ttll-15 n=1 Tax=Amphiura filiformis TaxID=82378 RepID=UPI003B211C01
MYSPPGSTTKHHRSRGVSTRSLYIIVIALLMGILVTLWNVYQLRWLHEKHSTGMPEAVSSNVKDSDKPVVWVHAKRMETGYLDHVLAVFNRIGYVRGGQESDWDVLWAHDYPFTQLSMAIGNMKPHQKVNHFPGTGYVTNKVYLATSDIKYIPIAFQMPKQQAEFQKEVERSPDRLWVQKSSSHRGIKVKSTKELNLNAKDTFIQEYIQKPFLIDGRKFDLGLYVITTSVDPLRVYMVDDEMLVRFCPKDYYPTNFEDVDKYVVGDDYTPMWEMPSLKKWFVEGKYSFKESLYAYFRSVGKDSGWVEDQIYEAVKGVFMNKQPQLKTALEKYPHKNVFFEMMRFDFVLDEDLNVYLMEVNMSPNLSSTHFTPNKYLYEHVIFNTLSVVGVARSFPTSLKSVSNDAFIMAVSERDIQVKADECGSDLCKTCENQDCKLCNKCLIPAQRELLKAAYLEHKNRATTRRVYPEPMTQETAEAYDDSLDEELDENDQLMRVWFRAKCIEDASWCR